MITPVPHDPQGHSLLSLIDHSVLTDGKRAPRSCPMQADRPMHSQEEQTAFCSLKGDAGGQNNGSRHCRKAVSQGLKPQRLKLAASFATESSSLSRL